MTATILGETFSSEAESPAVRKDPSVSRKAESGSNR
jgi:hypothetical protein